MSEMLDKPLVACVTTEDGFCGRIAAAAGELGADFCSSGDLGASYQACRNRQRSCLVVDIESTHRSNSQLVSIQMAQAHVFLAVVPRGDVQAAFRAASEGAINVLEKPLVPVELVINLRTAFASESRMAAFLQSQQRFSCAFFDCLSDREKSILRLLMDGEPNKRVAAILDLGLRTVEAQRAQVIKKLQVSSFVELIKLVATVETDFLKTRKEIFESILPTEFIRRNAG